MDCFEIDDPPHHHPLGTSPALQLTTGIDPLADTLCSLSEYQMMCPETDVRIYIILGTVYN
jgi:hypothetical protein